MRWLALWGDLRTVRPARLRTISIRRHSSRRSKKHMPSILNALTLMAHTNSKNQASCRQSFHAMSTAFWSRVNCYFNQIHPVFLFKKRKTVNLQWRKIFFLNPLVRAAQLPIIFSNRNLKGHCCWSNKGNMQGLHLSELTSHYVQRHCALFKSV